MKTRLFGRAATFSTLSSSRAGRVGTNGRSGGANEVASKEEVGMKGGGGLGVMITVEWLRLGMSIPARMDMEEVGISTSKPAGTSDGYQGTHPVTGLPTGWR